MNTPLPTRRALLLTAGSALLPALAFAQSDLDASDTPPPAPPPRPVVLTPPLPPAEVLAELPKVRLLGSGRLRYMGLHICDARLWVGPDFSAATFASHPLALELQYGRGLSGRRIADRSMSEMARIGTVPEAKAELWAAEMNAAFPDVRKDDRITGVLRPGASVCFYVNGVRRREVADAQFAALFFAIWLSPAASEQGLREALLGPGRGAP